VNARKKFRTIQKNLPQNCSILAQAILARNTDLIKCVICFSENDAVRVSMFSAIAARFHEDRIGFCRSEPLQQLISRAEKLFPLFEQ
jgi:hypothetical protein